MGTRGITAAIGACLIALVAAAVAYAGKLDQQQPTIQDMAPLNPAINVGQTFLAERAGALDQVDIAVEREACDTPTTSIVVDIRETLGGRPTDKVLASNTTAWSTLPEEPAFVSFTFDEPAAVNVGTRYAIVISAVGGGSCTRIGRAAGPPDPYGLGDRLTQTPPDPWEFSRNQDMAFKTYVDPTTVKCGGKTATHVGTDGKDTIVGTSDHDVIAGLGGRDTIKGLAGDDRICGGEGADAIHGGAGADRLKGHEAADLLNGAGGSDSCVGGPGGDESRACETERSL